MSSRSSSSSHSRSNSHSKSSSPKKNNKPNEWKLLEEGKSIVHSNFDFDNIEEDSIKNIDDNVISCLDHFELFIDRKFLELIAYYTNQYAEKQKSKIEENMTDNEKRSKSKRVQRWNPVTPDDMMKFICVSMSFSAIQLRDYKFHFAVEDVLYNNFPAAKLMNRWRYEIINGFLHAADSDAEDIDKIVPTVRYIMEKSRKYYEPSGVVTIDERMISYRGRCKYIMHDPSKPTSWGFKPYILSDYKSGYTYGFELFDDFDDEGKDLIKNYGKIYAVVTKLMQQLKSNVIHYNKKLLCCDGLYTSEELLNNSEDYYIIGCLRPNRIRSNKEEIMEPIAKNKYEYYYKINEKDNTYCTITKFHDTKLCFLLDNCVNTGEKLVPTHYNRYKKFVPEVVEKYRKFMKGVDLSNQYISYIENDMKRYKWWKRVFFHMIDVAILNSFILYKKHMKKEGMRTGQFRDELIREIVGRYAKTELYRPISAFPYSSTAKKIEVHYLTQVNDKNDCYWCKKINQTSKVFNVCIGCGLFFHPGKCFEEFHRQLDIWKNRELLGK